MNPPDSNWLVNFLLGAAFVVLYATARLRGPEADRSFTTLQRYSFSALYFALGHLAIYLLAVCVLWAVDLIHDTEADAYLIGIPGWLALVTAALLPRLKPFSILDTMFRAHARHIGGMSMEAMRLRDCISSAGVTLKDSDFRELHFGLLRRGVDIGNQRNMPDDTLHAQILQAAQLKFLLDKCMRQRSHFTFARDNKRSLELITRRFDHLMFRTSRSVDAIGQLHQLANTISGKSGNWEALGALAENQAFAPETTAKTIGPAGFTSRLLITNLREDMRYFVNDVSLLLARMTLRKRWSEHGRVKLLARAGITVKPLERPRFRSLIAVFSAVALCMLAATGMSSYAKTVPEQLQGLVMVSLMFVIGVLCAVYPKQYFAFANTNIRGRPPYLFFVIAGAAAASLAFVVGLIFRLIRFQNGEEALRNAWQNSPWLIVTFTLAFTLAILVQDTSGDQDKRHDFRRSLRDALVLGLALAVAMIVVQSLLGITRPDFTVANYRLALLGLGLGAFIGFVIPKRFRTVYRLTTLQREELRKSHHDGRLADAWRFVKGATP